MLSEEWNSSSAARTSCCTARCGLALTFLPCRYSKAASAESTSHRPSHARMSSSPSCTRVTRTSGSAVTSDSFHGRSESEFAYTLKSRSPSARETARVCITRPLDTQPPARVIRAVSSLRSGLWSTVMRSGLPSRRMYARESPALATSRWVGEISAQTAVLPLQLWVVSRNCASVDRKAARKLAASSAAVGGAPGASPAPSPEARPPAAAAGAARRRSCSPRCTSRWRCRCALANSDASLPPWPS
mmetsp:Transcript_16314/g.40395  ORF Transcript_16314/g.40395 Transcript_16314/m.40395 type:complete len:245 (+) Transcript_16314:156-890(+)